MMFVKELERIDVWEALNRLKERRSAVFPSICDPDTGNVVLFHLDRGWVLGCAWFGSLATDITDPNLSPDVTLVLSADQSGSSAGNKQGGATQRPRLLVDFRPRRTGKIICLPPVSHLKHPFLMQTFSYMPKPLLSPMSAHSYCP
jgi:hypothetical protein